MMESINSYQTRRQMIPSGVVRNIDLVFSRAAIISQPLSRRATVPLFKVPPMSLDPQRATKRLEFFLAASLRGAQSQDELFAMLQLTAGRVRVGSRPCENGFPPP